MTQKTFNDGARKPQSMALADDLFPSLEAGEKICTIRAGKRDFENGPLTFYTSSRNGHQVTVNVTEVRHKTLGELTDAEAQMDGASTAQEMAQALKRFYPDINADSMITIVIYDPPVKTAPAAGAKRAPKR